MFTYIKIISASIATIILFWVLDAAVDTMVHYDESFVDCLIFNKQEIAFRSFFSFSFLIFGIFMAALMNKQKMAEGSLKDNEQKLRTLFESATDAIFIMDLEGNFIDVNSTAYARLGYTKEEMLSMHISELDPPEFAARVPEQMARIKDQGVAVFESAHIKRDGTIMPVEINSRILDYGGQEVYFSIIRDISERKQAEAQLKRALEEKDVLLREIHHRVKNNLSVIQSLLHLQARYIRDTESKSYFMDAQNRVISMSMIHERLSRSDNFAKLNGSEFISSLVNNLYHSYNLSQEKVRLKINIPEVLLDVDTLIPCSLIINELVSNAFKYAFPEDREGEVSVELHEGNDHEFKLVVKDTGIGIPENLNVQSSKSLGLMIINALTSQIRGQLELQHNSGTEFILTFKEKQFR